MELTNKDKPYLEYNNFKGQTEFFEVIEELKIRRVCISFFLYILYIYIYIYI